MRLRPSSLPLLVAALAAPASAVAAIHHAADGARFVIVGHEARPAPPSLPAAIVMEAAGAGVLEIGYGFSTGAAPARPKFMVEQRPAGAPQEPTAAPPAAGAAPEKAKTKAAGTFRVRVEGRGAPIEIERRLTPSSSKDERWQELAIPIPGGSGALTIHLGASAAAGASPVFSLPILREPSSEPGATAVLVLVDTLRADRLSGYGYPEPLTPHMDRFFRKGAAWPECLATSNWTLPSHADLFTGLRPFEHGLRLPIERAGPLDPSTPAWVGGIRARGIETLAMTGDVFVSPGSGLERGFDRFATTTKGMRHGLALLLPWLEARRREPFFLFFHTYDVHSPYAAQNDAPLSSRGLGGASGDAATGRLGKRARVDAQSALYDDGVLGADRVFGLLAAHLRHLSLDERTTLVLTSDHGDHLGEEGKFGHTVSLDDPLLHVPLLARGPRVTPGPRSGLVELRAVGPMIAAALEGDAPVMEGAPHSVASEIKLPGQLRLTAPAGIVRLPSASPGPSRELRDLAIAYLGATRPGLNVYLSRATARDGLTLRLTSESPATKIAVWPPSRDAESDPAAGRVRISEGDGPVSIQILPLPASGPFTIAAEGAELPDILCGPARSPCASGGRVALDAVLAKPGAISLDPVEAARPQIWVIGVPDPDPGRAVPLDEETRRQLEALGYVD